MSVLVASMTNKYLRFHKYGVLFGVNENFFLLPSTFIAPLRAAQQSAASEHGWTVIDADLGFRSADAEWGYCGIAKACDTDACPAGDRVRWWADKRSNINASGLPRLDLLSDFNPYDSTRMRGMRYGMDAFLTSVDLLPSGAAKLDWVASSAHPTAHVHARVANLLKEVKHAKTAAAQ